MEKTQNIKDEWLDLDIFGKTTFSSEEDTTDSDNWSDRWSDDCCCCVGGFSK